jgi:heat shock protein HslJ
MKESPPRQSGWMHVVAAMSLTATLLACGGETLTGASVVVDGEWKLRNLQRRDGSVVEVTSFERYTLRFENDGRLSVRADCNRCNGAYSLEGGELALGPLACTRVACPPDSIDGDFLAVLAGSRSYGVRDGVLTIRSDGGGLRLRR